MEIKRNNLRNFVIRTVKNNKVKIYGSYYSPKEETNGRFDGKKYGFGIYRDEFGNSLEYVFMWGSKAYYKTGLQTDDDILMTNDNHEYEWAWWWKV